MGIQKAIPPDAVGLSFMALFSLVRVFIAYYRVCVCVCVSVLIFMMTMAKKILFFYVYLSLELNTENCELLTDKKKDFSMHLVECNRQHLLSVNHITLKKKRKIIGRRS